MNSFILIIFGLIFSVALNAIAQIFLRSGALQLKFEFTLNFLVDLLKSVNIWYGMACYGISIFLWIIVLSKVQVSLAYPFQGLGYIFGTFLAWLYLNEKVSLLNSIGLIVILIGIIILSAGIYNNEK